MMFKMLNMLLITMCLIFCHVGATELTFVQEMTQDLQDSRPPVQMDVVMSKLFSAFHNNGGPDKPPANSCHCKSNTCGCCAQLDVKKIHLKEKACVSVSYLPKEIGLELDVKLNGKDIIKKKVSAKNPPPICAGIPHLHKAASICLRFKNLSVSGKKFSGCVDIEVQLEHVLAKDFPLGCFRIGDEHNLRQLLTSYDVNLQLRETQTLILPDEPKSEVGL